MKENYHSGNSDVDGSALLKRFLNRAGSILAEQLSEDRVQWRTFLHTIIKMMTI
jgi:hypothetical protein